MTTNILKDLYSASIYGGEDQRSNDWVRADTSLESRSWPTPTSFLFIFVVLLSGCCINALPIVIQQPMVKEIIKNHVFHQ